VNFLEQVLRQLEDKKLGKIVREYKVNYLSKNLGMYITIMTMQFIFFTP